MNDNERKKTDHLIDQVRQVRNTQVQKYGGLHGWVTHLQEMQRQNPKRKFLRPKQASAEHRR